MPSHTSQSTGYREGWPRFLSGWSGCLPSQLLLCLTSFPFPPEKPHQNSVSEGNIYGNNLEPTCTCICSVQHFIISNRLLGDIPHNCLQYTTPCSKTAVRTCKTGTREGRGKERGERRVREEDQGERGRGKKRKVGGGEVRERGKSLPFFHEVTSWIQAISP